MTINKKKLMLNKREREIDTLMVISYSTTTTKMTTMILLQIICIKFFFSFSSLFKFKKKLNE